MKEYTDVRDGWVWPKKDTACWKYLSRRPNVPLDVSKYCKKLNVVIQAGGNAGMYVKKYENIFNTVYTFEPDPINFYCLVQNTNENVIKFQGCLGNTHDFIDLAYDEINPKKYNAGGYRVKGKGAIPTFILDEFNFCEVDLIHLDIEGFELFALQGAVETIKRCKPVIALELNGLSEKYGHTDNDIKLFLSTLNYTEVGIVNDDVVFQYRY